MVARPAAAGRGVPAEHAEERCGARARGRPVGILAKTYNIGPILAGFGTAVLGVVPDQEEEEHERDYAACYAPYYRAPFFR
jgi:hypothetical protein